MIVSLAPFQLKTRISVGLWKASSISLSLNPFFFILIYLSVRLIAISIRSLTSCSDFAPIKGAYLLRLASLKKLGCRSLLRCSRTASSAYLCILLSIVV